MTNQTSLAVLPQSNPEIFPAFDESTCPHERVLVRWWRNANNEGTPRVWRMVEGWCYGASTAAMHCDAQASIDYDTACGIAFERDLMAICAAATRAPARMSHSEAGRISIGLFAVFVCLVLVLGFIASVAQASEEVKLSAGRTADSGIAEYNQVLRMVVESRAEVIAGNPDDFIWRCIDEKTPCVVKAVAP